MENNVNFDTIAIINCKYSYCKHFEICIYGCGDSYRGNITGLYNPRPQFKYRKNGNGVAITIICKHFG